MTVRHSTEIDKDKDDRESAEIKSTYEIREQVTSGGWIWTLSLSPRRCLYTNECWNYFVNKKKKPKKHKRSRKTFNTYKLAYLFQDYSHTEQQLQTLFVSSRLVGAVFL